MLIKFKNNYILWAHDISNRSWNLESYKKLCVIDNVSDFWKLFNNFEKLGIRFMQFFFMKDYTQPLWEHESNRNGGMCSFRIELDDSVTMWTEFAARMVTECLNNDSDDINGISFSPKNSWVIIKIWNKDNKKDLSKTLLPEIINKYEKFSMKYKENAPEY